MKIDDRQVNRPRETTAIWFSFPCCHTNLAFSMAISGSSSSRPCQTFTFSLTLLLDVDSLLGFGGVTPPLSTCGSLVEVYWSVNPQTDVASRKAQIRKTRVRSSMTPIGADTEQELCRKKNIYSVSVDSFTQKKPNSNILRRWLCAVVADSCVDSHSKHFQP